MNRPSRTTSRRGRAGAAMLLAAFAVALAALPAAALGLEFSGSAVVPGEAVRLGEVAQISASAGEQDRAAALQAVVLGQAPRPGQTRVFTRAQIALRLKAAGFAPAQLTLSGSEQVTVRRPGRPLGKEEAESLYGQEIARTLGVPAEKVKVTLVNWTDPVLPEGQVRLAVRAEADAIARAAATGTLTGQVDVFVDGQPQVALRPRALVTVSVTAVVAREGLAKGSLVLPGQIEEVEFDLSRLPEGALRSAGQAVGQQVLRPVAPGAPLKRADLTAPLLVRRGDKVTLVAEAGPVSLSVPGVAQGDGAAGQVVRVQNLQSGRIVEATVRGEGLVVMDLGAAPEV